MTRAPGQTWRRDGRSFRGGRLAHLPGAAEISRFIAQLRGPTRSSAARALVDGVIVVVTLERRGVRPLFGAKDRSAATSDPRRAMEVAAAVDAALGLIPVAPTCLRRSVTLLRELRRLGLDARLHIGVRKVADKIEAHAWVQAGDVVVNDDPGLTSGYVELASGELERLLPHLK